MSSVDVHFAIALKDKKEDEEGRVVDETVGGVGR